MDSELKQSHYFNNFQRSRLGGLKGPLHLCLQICNNFFFVSIKNLGHNLVIIMDKPKIII
jgi:hypothetical protein